MQSHHAGPAGATGHVQQPLTKAIVFSQFWMHILLICAHLRAHDVEPSILKRDLSPRAKAEALDVFRVSVFIVCNEATLSSQ